MRPCYLSLFIPIIAVVADNLLDQSTAVAVASADNSLDQATVAVAVDALGSVDAVDLDNKVISSKLVELGMLESLSGMKTLVLSRSD